MCVCVCECPQRSAILFEVSLIFMVDTCTDHKLKNLNSADCELAEAADKRTTERVDE